MTQVEIEHGTLSGGTDGDVHRFLGIPFAAPPVGPLRWRPAAPPEPWDGVRDATRFAASPIQTVSTAHSPDGSQSEDCLYLNLWTTTLDPQARQPVMFWIHGGGFLNGACSMPIYDGTDLARRGVTVVSVEYRLGAFGFLADPTDGANAGVTDWVAGLRWVAANIEAFGGDPGNVCIFGQSAGAAAVRALLSTPSAHGLFHRAIIQSAGFDDYAVVESPSFERAAAATSRMLTRFGCRNIEDLRGVPAELIRAASFDESGTNPPAGQVHTPANLVWYPVLDDNIVRPGFDGWAEHVPVMLGCTQDESRMFIFPQGQYAHPEMRPEDIYTPDTLRHMAVRLGGAASDDILRHCTGTDLTPYEALTELFTAAIWHEPALATLDTLAPHGRSLYYYRFSRLSPGSRASGMLAHHAAENPYIFGVLQPAAGYNDDDRSVSDAVQHAWTEFARTGMPRHRDGSPWPVYDADNPAMAVIGDAITTRPLDPTILTNLIQSQRRVAPHH